jgi:hypothetical protein
MAKYDVVNTDTGETKIIDVSVHEITQWYEDNPEWRRDWSQGAAPSIGMVGEVYDKLKKTHPGWNDVLHKASKAPKSIVKPI